MENKKSIEENRELREENAGLKREADLLRAENAILKAELKRLGEISKQIATLTEKAMKSGISGATEKPETSAPDKIAETQTEKPVRPKREKISLRGWSVALNPRGYYVATKRGKNGTLSFHLGRERDYLDEVLSRKIAENTEKIRDRGIQT